MSNLVATITQRTFGVLTDTKIQVAVVQSGITVNQNTIISGGSTVEKTASTALGGHRAVISDGISGAAYADSSNLSHMGVVLGITDGAAISGTQAQIVISGDIVELSWNWTPNEFVYLGLNGLLTQTAPSSGFSLVLGAAIAPTVLNVRLGVPIQLF